MLVRVLRKARLLPYVNLTGKLQLDGKMFAIPILRGMGADNLHMSEIWMIEVIRIVRSLHGGSFVDIGTNIGQSLIKLKTVDSTANYVGFEPNPDCVSYVEELIRKNRFPHAVVIPVGVSNKTEILKLNFYDESLTDSSASLNENFRPGKKITHQKAVQVVDYGVIADVIPPDTGIVKIDVEGFELNVLQGIEPLIREKRPAILLEILPVYTPENTHRLQSQEGIEELFRKHHYRFFRIVKSNEGQLAYFAPIKGAIGIHSEISNCDYMVLPEELADQLAGRTDVKIHEQQDHA
ncbi:FkbM family methyltransferase [Puia dinghuensis]|uniref:Methyltransferase FkbM domain-containing protein n=1 Tax=Puia dinghuensis TaxID=1792502 RepID=A0A8J2UFK0_9BACT|nr:FkbM family methyltransferase [Puia dinghuensis]GGB08498.1 hypothetical protein GCM10011511_34960 [Puia dinghuensis]